MKNSFVLFFCSFLMITCNKVDLKSGNYLFKAEASYTFQDTVYDVYLAERKLELMNSCRECDHLVFRYAYDSGDETQKVTENTHVVHVFGDSVFADWQMTIGPEYSDDFLLSSSFNLNGKMNNDNFLEGQIKVYYKHISNGTYYGYKEANGLFSIIPD